MIKIILMMFCMFVIHTAEVSADINMYQRDGYRIYMDCEIKAAIRFEYSIKSDVGSAERQNTFMLDPGVPKECQQSYTRDYKTEIKPDYDRAHLVFPEHQDDSVQLSMQANYITNIVPMISSMNRGPWLETSQISECSRDHGTLWIIGGVIFDDSSNDGLFYTSHGLFKTPDQFWKLIYQPETKMISAWLIPNRELRKGESSLDFIVNPVELLDMGIPITWLRFKEGMTFDPTYFYKQFQAGCDQA